MHRCDGVALSHSNWDLPVAFGVIDCVDHLMEGLVKRASLVYIASLKGGLSDWLK